MTELTENAPSSDRLLAPVEAVMLQVANLLGLTLSDGDPSEFWLQVAVALTVATDATDALKLAKALFERLDEAWDDDYVEEDGSTLSIEAYETLYGALRNTPSETLTTPTTATVDEDDEEDDSIGALPSSFVAVANTAQWGVSTVLDQIRAGTTDLDPHWQRKFVWKLKKQRRLIESILLGLPIPSMLLFRDSTSGITYVIDGRQRLETLSRFTAGKPKTGEQRRRFKTFGPKEEGWRDGEKLFEAAGKYYEDLPQHFKTQFDRATLVMHEFVDLPREYLYQIFRRYNTGAEKLRAAEVRNAVYQDEPLHEMMYQLAGELGLHAEYSSDRERDAAATLYQIMRQKTARYGAYDFVGRYFAFSYMTTGTVATAINEFMRAYKNHDVAALREEFIRVLEHTCQWYEYPLSVSKNGHGVTFHLFAATIQMVSTRIILLNYIDTRRTDGAAVRRYITEHWNTFVGEVLQQKQNATAFWQRQKEWTARLERVCMEAV